LRSMAVPSDGSYGIEEGLMSSFPVRLTGGEYSIEQGLELADFAQGKLDVTVNELKDERNAVKELGLI
jgi:malate dehydrogenase